MLLHRCNTVDGYGSQIGTIPELQIFIIIEMQIGIYKLVFIFSHLGFLSTYLDSFRSVDRIQIKSARSYLNWRTWDHDDNQICVPEKYYIDIILHEICMYIVYVKT